MQQNNKRMRRAYVGLEAREQVDEERVARRVGHLEDALLREQRLDLVARDDVALFQRLDREVLARVAVLRQDHLHVAQIDRA